MRNRKQDRTLSCSYQQSRCPELLFIFKHHRLKIPTLTGLLISLTSFDIPAAIGAADEITGSGKAHISAKYFPAAKVEKWSHTYVPSYCNTIPNRQMKLVLSQRDKLFANSVKKHLHKQSCPADPDPDKTALQGPAHCPDSSATILRTREMHYLGWHLDDSGFSRDHSGRFCIGTGDGEAVIWTQKQTSIQIGSVQLEISAGTVLLLCQDDDYIQIVNLYDTRIDALKLIIADNRLTLRPGQECMVARSNEAFEKCRKRDPSLRRLSRRFKLPNCDDLVAICEISIPSLLNSHPILSMLDDSSEKLELQLSQKLLKMSVCLAFMGNSFETYLAHGKERYSSQRKTRSRKKE